MTFTRILLGQALNSGHSVCYSVCNSLLMTANHSLCMAAERLAQQPNTLSAAAQACT